MTELVDSGGLTQDSALVSVVENAQEVAGHQVFVEEVTLGYGVLGECGWRYSAT
ncbi:hypothetical protein [Micromonospora sp. NPDC005220]|uniref:hypothetical protein n=1 Tax=Micromonospora sp. NPDC005220 TaxID=3155589 RepID=UPI0033B75470